MTDKNIYNGSRMQRLTVFQLQIKTPKQLIPFETKTESDVDIKYIDLEHKHIKNTIKRISIQVLSARSCTLNVLLQADK